MKKAKLYNTTTTSKTNNNIHIDVDYTHLANPMHLAIQQTYRAQVHQDKTKFNRSRNKRNLQREISSY